MLMTVLVRAWPYGNNARTPCPEHRLPAAPRINAALSRRCAVAAPRAVCLLSRTLCARWPWAFHTVAHKRESRRDRLETAVWWLLGLSGSKMMRDLGCRDNRTGESRHTKITNDVISRDQVASNEAFWAAHNALVEAEEAVVQIVEVEDTANKEQEIMAIEAQIVQLNARLKHLRAELNAGAKRKQILKQRYGQALQSMSNLVPRLEYSSQLLEELSLSVFGEVGPAGRCRAARSCRRFQQVVASGRERGIFRVKVMGLAAGEDHTVMQGADGETFTVGNGMYGQLGHGTQLAEHMPSVVHALSRKKVVGVAAGFQHSIVWTSSGEVFTFGNAKNGALGHGDEHNQALPRLVAGLAGQRVVGATGGKRYTVVYTAEGKTLFPGRGPNPHLALS